ncbi:C5 protein [Malvastrum bright yellow mosaic virus]|uniref:C5 protein n=1 Tax=Malvastrum bright yellow mosaic virus TaxID=1906668 RepID=A0A1D8KV18_9GEMI|nr:C5 protein [Malvastrum bright yellow mosaic virus]AOV62487.1 C5 protein [Malvastrum bright yellow mosaic virus]
MSTCHIQQKGVLSMVIVFPCFLVVIHDVVVQLPKTPNYSLLVACILTTCDFGIEFVHDLETISKIVLDRGSTGLVVEHVEHLSKVHRITIGSSIPDQPEHHTVRVVLQLNIIIHPHLT